VDAHHHRPPDDRFLSSDGEAMLSIRSATTEASRTWTGESETTACVVCGHGSRPGAQLARLCSELGDDRLRPLKLGNVVAAHSSTLDCRSLEEAPIAEVRAGYTI